MRYPFLAIGLLATCVGAQPVKAVPVPMTDVPAMTQASDLVVVGRASQTQNPSAPFLVTVDRVLKGGETATPQRLTVQPNPTGQGYPSVDERQYGIFFLNRQARGNTYTVTDPFHPVLPASPQQSPAQAASGNALGNVAAELAGVLTAPAATLTDPVSGVQHLITAAPAAQAQFVDYEAATALKSIPYAVAGQALNAIALSDQVPARLWAMASLFSMADFDDDSAKTDYLQSAMPILVNPEPSQAFSVSMLANAIEGHLNSPQTVPALAAMLGSKEVSVRRAAASVLSAIATPAVVEPLAMTALNDSDENVRYYAVRGLALVANPATAPTIATFRQQQTELLQQWRAWARSNGHVPP